MVYYLEKIGLMAEDSKAKAVVPLIIAYHHAAHLWKLKGHTPGEFTEKQKQGKKRKRH